MINTEVAVIGAGPAGSGTAEKIASAGHDVLLIEKDSFAGETSVCGGALDASFATELDVHSSIAKKITKCVFHYTFGIQKTNLESISFARNKFDRYLADRAVARGARILTSTKSTRASRESDGIEITVENRKSGQIQTVKGKLAIFADGPSTQAHKFFGIGFHGTPTNMDVGAIYEFEHDGSGDTYDFFFDTRISPWGYGWIFPKWDHLNVGVGCLASKIKYHLKDYLDYFAYKHPIVSKQLAGRKRLRFAVAAIPGAPAERISDSRIMVVGDAGGMTDAIWGGGIGPALRAGEIAADVASKALEQNRYDAAFLSMYDTLWKGTQEYATLRKSEILTQLALPWNRLYANLYPRLNNFLVVYSKMRGRLFGGDWHAVPHWTYEKRPSKSI